MDSYEFLQQPRRLRGQQLPGKPSKVNFQLTKENQAITIWQTSYLHARPATRARNWHLRKIDQFVWTAVAQMCFIMLNWNNARREMIEQHLLNKRKEDSFKLSLSQQMLPTLASSNLRPAAMRHSEDRSPSPSMNAKPVKAREWSTTEIHQHLDQTIANATELVLLDTYKLEISV